MIAWMQEGGQVSFYILAEELCFCGINNSNPVFKKKKKIIAILIVEGWSI